MHKIYRKFNEFNGVKCVCPYNNIYGERWDLNFVDCSTKNFYMLVYGGRNLQILAGTLFRYKIQNHQQNSAWLALKPTSILNIQRLIMTFSTNKSQNCLKTHQAASIISTMYSTERRSKHTQQISIHK